MLCTIGIVASGKAVVYPAAGTLIGTYCQSASGSDATGIYYSGNWVSSGIYADGMGGSYTSGTILGEDVNGCFRPSGWTYYYSASDATIQWYHGANWGYFSYGTNYSAVVADGLGGTNNTGGQNITAYNGQVVNQYTSIDGASGYPTNYILYFRLSDTSLQTSEYIVAGTFLGNSCTTLYDYPDAAGSLFTVAVKQYQYADGTGGYYYTYVTNDYDCGYLPAGYYTQYSYSEAYISYNTYEMNPQTFNYGNTYAYTMADGMNGYTVGAGDNYYYPAGYIFYSYHDFAGAQTVNFTFDGVNGYYVAYVMD